MTPPADSPPLRRLLVVQHVACEPLGTLDPLLRRRKVRIRYVNFAREPTAMPDLRGYDALIVLGGPQNVDEQHKYPHLKAELALIDAALRQELPVLGICLGAQLLAHALGAPVGRNPTRELGWADVQLTEAGRQDPVVSALGPLAPMFHWHGDTFAIPDGCERLAESEQCAHQAFRYGARSYGFQFHLEVDGGLVQRWLEVYATELRVRHGDSAAPRILAETAEKMADLQTRADLVFGRLCELWGWRPRQPALHLGHRMTGPL